VVANQLLTRRRRVEKMRAAREELARSHLRPVKLRIVASMLHHERSGGRRDSMRGPEYLQRLNEAAAALSAVADIYRVEGGALVRIPKDELEGAQYLDGGNVLRTAAGALYHPLHMRRAEAIGAITLLAAEASR
jgi:hypothetical protein